MFQSKYLLQKYHISNKNDWFMFTNNDNDSEQERFKSFCICNELKKAPSVD